MVFDEKSHKYDRLKIWQTFTWKVTIKHYGDGFGLNPFKMLIWTINEIKYSM
jgi:hypothetical protein